MEPESPKPTTAGNLMDKIATDPGIINRTAAEADGVVSVAEAISPKVPVIEAGATSEAPPVVAEGASVQMDGRSEFGAPVFNLLIPKDGAPVVLSGALAPVAPRASSGNKIWLVSAVVALLVLGVGGYLMYVQFNIKPQVAAITPSSSMTPSPTPTASPSPTPTVTPSPTPAPIPAAANVTAPAAVPTSDHPQAVTVKSRSGLWLRSSGNSSSKNNIIGWIPYGGSVSVDAVGEFWWHGTYRGKTGYFASNYTQ